MAGFIPESVAEFIPEGPAAFRRNPQAGTSIASYARSIRAFAGAVAPERDWHWLAQKAFRMKGRAVPRRNKRLRIVNSAHLFDLGFELMERSTTEATDLTGALQFRDGLMVALLAARPLRLGNFSRLELGRTLLYRSPEYWLCFSEQETKTGRPINMPLPGDLHEPVEKYLRGYRKILLQSRTGEQPTPALWLSGKGRPLEPDQIRAIINKRTKAAFGHSVNPHLFRDCLATTLATDDPEHVLCAVPILGHTSFRMMEKHYNQATMGTATRKFASALLELRNDLIGQFGRQDIRDYLIALEGRGNARS